MYGKNYEKCKFDQPFLSFQPKQIFIGESKVCEKTEVSGANDSSDFDGKTTLLECGDNEYVSISGLEISKFKTEDKIIDYISLVGNIMCPYAVMLGEKYTYFIAHHYNFIENNEIEEGTFLNATNKNLDPFLYHLRKWGVDSFLKLERSQFHSYWPHDDEEDENEEDENVYLVEEIENLI